MLTSSNANLLRVRMRGTDTDARGEPSWAEHNLQLDHSEWNFATWLDFRVGRRVETWGEKSDIRAVWELKEWIQDRIVEIAGRRLETGDIVLFDVRPNWFVLGEVSADAGIFHSIPYQKFNLVYTEKARSIET